MPIVNYLDPKGIRHSVDVDTGASVMDGAIRAGVPGILAECGGNLSCATCHVYVEDRWIAEVGCSEPASAEDEMLEFTSSERGAGSRLSCQIKMSEALDGLVVRVAPRQS